MQGSAYHSRLVVLGRLRSDLVPREGRQLLDAHHSDVFGTGASLLALLQQLVVDLAGAEDELADLVGIAANERVCLRVEPHELGARPHLLQRGRASAVSQQILRRDDDERLSEVAMDLAAQHVVVVGRGGAVHHLPVAGLDLHALRLHHRRHHVRVLVHLLQEPLHATRGVLGALAHVAVREQHRQAALTQPLVLAGRDELVDHHLQ